MPGITRGFASGAFALELDGTVAGFVNSAQGGGPYGEVVRESGGPDPVVRKHIGNVKYEDIVITCGVPSGALATWISGFLAGQSPVHNGALVAFDFNGTPRRRLEWHQGRITSVTFPALDASSHDACHLTITIAVEFTQHTTPGGAAPIAARPRAQLWLASNFTVAVSGIATNQIAAVGDLTVTQSLQESAIGGGRLAQMTPGKVDVGDLVLTVGPLNAADFEPWLTDFVVNGNNGPANEKISTIRYLSPNFQDELMSLNLSGVGIYRLLEQTGKPDTIGHSSITMYCELAALTVQP